MGFTRITAIQEIVNCGRYGECYIGELDLFPLVRFRSIDAKMDQSKAARFDFVEKRSERLEMRIDNRRVLEGQVGGLSENLARKRFALDPREKPEVVQAMAEKKRVVAEDAWGYLGDRGGRILPVGSRILAIKDSRARGR